MMWLFSIAAFVSSFKDSVLDIPLNTRDTGFHRRPASFHLFSVLPGGIQVDSWAPSLLLGDYSG